MRTLENSTTFPKLDRVIRNQQRLILANAFVTFAFVIGTLTAASSLFIA